MPKKTTIDVGARVHVGSTLLGTVEQVVKRRDATVTAYPDLIVRAADGDARFAFPGALVRSRRRNHGHTTVQVDLGGRPLGDFQMAETDASPPVEGIAPARKADQRHALGPASEPEVWRIPVWREELVAEKRPVVLDTVRVRKRVETVEQRVNVPLEREEVIIEHLSPDEYDGRVATGPDEWIVPVHEERLVIQKQTVIVEYLRVSRRRYTEDRAVHEDVRREVVAIDSEVAGHLADSRTQDGTIPPAAP